MSVTLHAAALIFAGYTNSKSEIGGLAKPPVSSIQARILTYQKSGTLESFVTEKESVHMSEVMPPNHELVSVKVETSSSLPGLSSSIATPSKTSLEEVFVVAAAETVIDSSSLDVSPTIISSVTLEYPLSANGREGIVTLAIVIGGDGNVEEVNVVKAVPVGFFEAAAIAGFRNARFTPGLLGGVGVKSRMVIDVEFTPTNRGGSVAGQK